MKDGNLPKKPKEKWVEESPYFVFVQIGDWVIVKVPYPSFFPFPLFLVLLLDGPWIGGVAFNVGCYFALAAR